MGHYYFVDIDEKQEFWLLAIVLEAVLAPVSHPYVEAPQDDNTVLYMDTRCEGRTCSLAVVVLDTAFGRVHTRWAVTVPRCTGEHVLPWLCSRIRRAHCLVLRAACQGAPRASGTCLCGL